ncbi:MAG TPA: TolC family protein [Terriglobia bacterium]|nr:TolC family protein [Terriglobia bacterium]
MKHHWTTVRKEHGSSARWPALHKVPRPVIFLFVSLGLASLAIGAPERAGGKDVKPITLPQAVSIAMKHNPGLHGAESYADAVRRSIAMAESSRYPHVDFSENFTRGNNPVFVFSSLLMQRQFGAQNFQLGNLNFPAPLDNFRTQFTASAPLYDAGRTKREVHDARLDAQSAQHAKERTQQEVIFNVIGAYTNELLARENVQVAEASVKSAEEDLARAQARQEQGQALLSDMLLARVQLAQAKEDLIRARNSEAIGQASLNVAMGLQENAPTEIDGNLTQSSFESGALEDRQKQALALRPDYQQVLVGKEKASINIAGARAQFLPTVNAFAGWEVDNQDFASRGGNNWTAGAQVNLNIFDGGQRRARLAQSHAKERQAEAMVTQMASAVRLQVREAFMNLTAASDRVQVSRESASQIEESLRILRDRYETGLATITDVLGTETAHARAQGDFLNALYDYRMAYAALELATGELAPQSPAVVR